MISVEHIDVYGFEHAIRGMRNPLNSWDKSDSKRCEEQPCAECRLNVGPPHFCYNYHNNSENVIAGDNDVDLMRRLYKSGTEHRTYARMVMVWMDITAPLYWWKEMDRYTVGKSQVSCSTMHKIADREFTLDDFSHEHLLEDGTDTLKRTIEDLNSYRYIYLHGARWCEPKDKRVWWQMIQLLPSSYNQKRTICMSYEVVFKIIRERTGHKLDEWNEFVEILKTLPYVKEIMGEEST